VRGASRQHPEVARFYLDEDVPHATAEIGSSLGLEVVAAKDAQPSLPQDDPIHLQTAARDRRIMVTYNRDDFLAATRDSFAAGEPHAGLLILTHKLPRDPERIAHALARWVEERRAEGGWPMQSYEVDFLSH
jgi:predicted nuclease of predicted toxin-antitoxin system